jgi:hypothetical protein
VAISVPIGWLLALEMVFRRWLREAEERKERRIKHKEYTLRMNIESTSKSDVSVNTWKSPPLFDQKHCRVFFALP